MRYFLLLFPIREYVEAITRSFPSSVKEEMGDVFATLVRERYRKTGFKVAMVFFSTIADPQAPDLSRVWAPLPIQNNDTIIPCGLTFEEHCWAKVYPKEGDILSVLSSPIEELVIGGFHLWDCVDKMAKYAYSRGIPVSVDEDLTELFFYAAPSAKNIPFSREISANKTREEIQKYKGSGVWEIMQEVRQGKPWLLQVE